MEWLLLGGLCIMWVAFLIPAGRRRHSPDRSVEDFERRMELLAQAESHAGSGRWIVTPRKGMPFVGHAERQRERARERRRRVFVFLLEAITLTFLIGLVPPLRDAWYVSAGLGALLLIYVWLLLSIKHQESIRAPQMRTANATPARRQATPAAPAARYVAEGRSTWARPTFGGLGALGESDRVHVVVRTADDGAGA